MWADDGGWQIAIGLVATSLGIYRVFEFDESNEATGGFWWAALTFAGLLLILGGIAINTAKDEDGPIAREVRRARSARGRAERASVKADSAAEEAKRLEDLRLPAADGEPTRSTEAEARRAQERIDQATANAKRARKKAEDAAGLEREAIHKARELADLTKDLGDTAKEAEADRDKALNAMTLVERSVRKNRRSRRAADPTGDETNEGET